MAVSTLPPVIKSQPAVEKLNTFNGMVVTVTKHMGPRAIGGQSVVATQNMTLKQLLDLQVSLPLQYGPAHYYFNVVDAGGTGSDEWMVKLGPEQQEAPMAGPGSTIPFPGAPAAPVPNAPLDAGVTQIMPGYFYNEGAGLLMTPWRAVVQWRMGDAMPTPPAAGIPHAAATPWNQPQPQPWWQQGGAPGGWGGFPIGGGESEELKLVKAQNEEMRRQRERDEERVEARRREDERQRREEERERRQEERDRQRDAQFNAVIERVSAKPAGPDPAVVALERQNEELRRQTQDTQRRLEDQQREDRLRAEMQETNRRFETMMTTMAANKSDPMLTMLMQMMNQMNASAMESVKAIQSSQTNSNAMAERQTQQLVAQLQGTQMTPLQLVQLMQQAKGDSAEGAKILVDSMKESMAVQKNVFEQLLEVAGRGDQPAWVGVVQGALDKIGGIGQAMMERNEREAARETYSPPAAVVTPAPARRAAIAPQQRVVQPTAQSARPPVTPIPSAAANTTPQRPDGTKYDTVKNEFILADGRRIPQPLVEKWGWAVVLADPEMNGMSQLPQPPVVVVAPAPEPGPMNGAVAHVEAASGPIPIARAKQRKVTKPKRGRRAAATTPAAPQGYTVEQMREMEPDDIRELTDQMNDVQFFGSLAQFVPQMRTANGGTPPPAEVARYVKQAEEFIKRGGQAMPPVIELLYAEQLEVLVEKIFPGAEEKYVKDVCDAIADIFGMGDDEGDEEGEEADA